MKQKWEAAWTLREEGERSCLLMTLRMRAEETGAQLIKEKISCALLTAWGFQKQDGRTLRVVAHFLCAGGTCAKDLDLGIWTRANGGYALFRGGEVKDYQLPLCVDACVLEANLGEEKRRIEKFPVPRDVDEKPDALGRNFVMRLPSFVIPRRGGRGILWKKAKDYRHPKVSFSREGISYEVNGEQVAYELEWQDEGGLFHQWTSTCEPPEGFIRIRVGDYSRRIVYLPQVLKRDCEVGTISYGGQILYAEAHPIQRREEQTCDVSLAFGKDFSLHIKMWRPLHEMMLFQDGKYTYSVPGDVIEVGAKELGVSRVVWLNELGGGAFSCDRLVEAFWAQNENTLCALMGGEKKFVCAQKLHKEAPVGLRLVMCGEARGPFYVWDYEGDVKACESCEGPLEDNTILFNANAVRPFVRMGARETVFGSFQGNALESFLVAANYGLYFVAMIPLREMTEERWRQEVEEPLGIMRQGVLTPEDQQALKRARRELNFLKGTKNEK